jgi:hypothetical protein
MKNVYMVNTEEATMVEVTTIKAVTELLGKRVTKKDIEAGKVEGVSLVEVTEEQDTLELTDVEQVLTDTQEEVDAPIHTVEQAPVATEEVEEVEEEVDTEEATEVAEPTEEQDTVEEEVVEEPTVAEGITYPEVGDFKEAKDIKAYYKKLTVEQLEEWVELEGLEVVHTDSPNIYRMRLAMAILYHHFPKAPAKASKKSSQKYPLSTEEYVQMAMENDVEVKDDKGNMQILRMYTIMALKNAGLITPAE